MSRSNYDKPFYVDVGTSIVAIRCASNHDIIVRYDYVLHPHTLNLAKEVCDRMNKEAENGRPLRNCDVGTAEAQSERFFKFCTPKRCDECKSHEDDSFYGCVLRWSQMPYEEDSEMKDYSNVRAVCFDCARKAGFVQKKKAVISFEDECGICKARRPCTDLRNDWMPQKRSVLENDGGAK